MKNIEMIAHILLIIGGINWGLAAWADMNLVDMIFGSIPILAKIIYGLVGLSGLYCAYMMVTGKGCCK